MLCIRSSQRATLFVAILSSLRCYQGGAPFVWGFSRSSRLGPPPTLSSRRAKTLELFCKERDAVYQCGRRQILTHFNGSGVAFLLGYLGFLDGSPALADDGVVGLKTVRKPWASTDALLPATRVRLLIDRAVDLAGQITKEDKLSVLDELLTKIDAILVSESDSTNDNVKWAFNIYTAKLRFDETFTVTSSKKERSEIIRRYNGLPDVKQVIQADLDLRDLYRNQVLTAIDDARAELRYQKKEFGKLRQDLGTPVDGAEFRGKLQPSFDGEELVSLLRSAQSACREWFDMISDEDVNAALDVVLSEQ